MVLTPICSAIVMLTAVRQARGIIVPLAEFHIGHGHDAAKEVVEQTECLELSGACCRRQTPSCLPISTFPVSESFLLQGKSRKTC